MSNYDHYNQAASDLRRLCELTTDQVIASATAEANLAIADAIREQGVARAQVEAWADQLNRALTDGDDDVVTQVMRDMFRAAGVPAFQDGATP